MNCTICEGVGDFLFIKNNYRILKCNQCNHCFTELDLTSKEVCEIYSDSYFYGGGDGYPDYIMEREMLIKRGEYYAQKVSQFVSQGRVLDIGAAAGFILKGFENMGWTGIGIEPNSTMVKYGKEILGINLHQGTLETVKLDSKFDLIVMIQVIPHLFNLNLSLRNASNFLKPNGYILIETWNRRSATSKLFGKYWHEYSPPSTLNFFDKKTLDFLMFKFDFYRKSSGRPKKKILSNHAKTLIKHKMEDTRLLRKIFGIVDIIPDNVLLPYPAEDLFWALYHKNK